MKSRRNFFRKAAGFLTLASAGHVLYAAAPAGRDQGNFTHVVFFWLKDDQVETRSKFEAELRPFIEGVKEIRSRHIGTPADTDREVIDSSWDYSLILGFDSKKEHDIYQDHPLHKQFIENASSLWTKVLVYDSVSS